MTGKLESTRSVCYLGRPNLATRVTGISSLVLKGICSGKDIRLVLVERGTTVNGVANFAGSSLPLVLGRRRRNQPLGLKSKNFMVVDVRLVETNESRQQGTIHWGGCLMSSRS